MSKRTFLVFLTATLIFPLGAYATQLNSATNTAQELKPAMKQIAQRKFGNRQGFDRGERMNQILEQLDLSAEQSEEIEVIREEFRTENEALRQEIKSYRQDGKAPFGSNASTAELREQHQRFQALRQELGDNRFEMMLQVREVLTPEQQDQLAELIEQKRNQRRSSSRNYR